jgi:hypothetical protein
MQTKWKSGFMKKTGDIEMYIMKHGMRDVSGSNWLRIGSGRGPL